MGDVLLPLRWLLRFACLFSLIVNHSFIEEFIQGVGIQGGDLIYAEDGSLDLGEVAGNFDFSLNEESNQSIGLENTIKLVGYSPTIISMEAHNQHQTNLNLKNERQGGERNVNTKFVNPWGFVFYLWNYLWSLRTSNPIHYHDLWDEIGNILEELDKLISIFCATKPISTSSSSSQSFCDDMRMILKLISNLQKLVIFILKVLNMEILDF